MQAKKFSTKMHHPLHDSILLHTVLEFVGVGEFVFVALVSSAWHAAYKQLPSGGTTEFIPSDQQQHGSSCQPCMTLLKAALASEARLQLSEQYGLPLNKQCNWRLQRAAGAYASPQVLLAAHQLGLPYSASVAEGAAEAANLCTLKWLHTEQLCPLQHNLCDYAAFNGDISMLKWCKSKGVAFTATTSYAAIKGQQLSAAQYLRSVACPSHSYACDGAAKRGDLAMLQWLHEHVGCASYSEHARCTVQLRAAV
jgi:hypothetical protein